MNFKKFKNSLFCFAMFASFPLASWITHLHATSTSAMSTPNAQPHLQRNQQKLVSKNHLRLVMNDQNIAKINDFSFAYDPNQKQTLYFLNSQKSLFLNKLYENLFTTGNTHFWDAMLNQVIANNPHFQINFQPLLYVNKGFLTKNQMVTDLFFYYAVNQLGAITPNKFLVVNTPNLEQNTQWIKNEMDQYQLQINFTYQIYEDWHTTAQNLDTPYQGTERLLKTDTFTYFFENLLIEEIDPIIDQLYFEDSNALFLDRAEVEKYLIYKPNYQLNNWEYATSLAPPNTYALSVRKVQYQINSSIQTIVLDYVGQYDYYFFSTPLVYYLTKDSAVQDLYALTTLDLDAQGTTTFATLYKFPVQTDLFEISKDYEKAIANVLLDTNNPFWEEHLIFYQELQRNQTVFASIHFSDDQKIRFELKNHLLLDHFQNLDDIAFSINDPNFQVQPLEVKQTNKDLNTNSATFTARLLVTNNLTTSQHVFFFPFTIQTFENYTWQPVEQIGLVLADYYDASTNNFANQAFYEFLTTGDNWQKLVVLTPNLQIKNPMVGETATDFLLSASLYDPNGKKLTDINHTIPKKVVLEQKILTTENNQEENSLANTDDSQNFFSQNWYYLVIGLVVILLVSSLSWWVAKKRKQKKHAHHLVSG